MKEPGRPAVANWTVLAWALGGLLLCLAVYQWTYHRAMDQLHARALRKVSAYRLDLDSTLDKYESLPFVMSLHGRVIEGLSRPDAPGSIPALNAYLAEVQQKAQVSAAFVIDTGGLTIAASNWNRQPTFVGNHYGFRPYAQRALQGDIGRFYGIGTTSGEPGYFLAHPVLDAAGRRIGALVIKIDLSAFERSWAGSDDAVALTDTHGVVFLSNVATWKYRSLVPLSPAAARGIDVSRQYAGQAIRPLAPDGAMAASDRVDESVGKLGWHMSLWTAPAPARQAALDAAVGTALLLCLAALAAGFYQQRRQSSRDAALARDALREASEQLEQRIACRTHELSATNRHLEQRYRDLQQAEQVLRQTQNELVQAGKLAMLGQMAAGMTHEITQPLTAMQAFVDNARAFLERQDLAAVRDNLLHIGDACMRLSHIVRQLKGFARKSEGSVGPVDLARALHNAALLLRADFAQRGATLDIRVDEEARVVGDRLRVEQVLVNLLRNALDAVEGCEERRVRAVLGVDGQACLSITDTGPGLAPQAREHLFEPFFTTKEAGRGLGLGLAISSSIVQAMSGELLALDQPQGGAEFVLKLPLWGDPSPEPVSS